MFPDSIISMMTDLSKLHVLLWSPSSGNLHKETLDRTVRTGIDSYLGNVTGQDYIVIAVADSRKEIVEVRDKLISARNRIAEGLSPE